MRMNTFFLYMYGAAGANLGSNCVGSVTVPLSQLLVVIAEFFVHNTGCGLLTFVSVFLTGLLKNVDQSFNYYGYVYVACEGNSFLTCCQDAWKVVEDSQYLLLTKSNMVNQIFNLG